MGIEPPSHELHLSVLTDVAALFQELGVYCHAIIVMHCISSAFVTVIQGTWTSAATAGGICDCFDYTIPGNGHSLPRHTLHFGGLAIVMKWASSTTTPRAEFREDSFVTKDCCIPGNRHQLPCHAVHLDQIRQTMNSVFLPHACMHKAGLSNRFCPSVRRKKLKSPHIDPHKLSKWSQTIANSKKLLYVYLTEVKALRFAVFRLFPTFHNYSQHWLHLFVTSESHQEQDTQCIWKRHASR